MVQQLSERYPISSITTDNLFLALSEVFVKFCCCVNINHLYTVLGGENYDSAFIDRKVKTEIEIL